MFFNESRNIIIPPWFSYICAAKRTESKFQSSRWVQLATVGIDNTPRVRTVVCRGWSESYEMEIYTDNRSEKNLELDLNNNVEVCWLFSKSKCQFRFRGTSRFDMGKDKLRHWEKLNEESKTIWSWPTPGDFCGFDQEKNLSVKKKEDPFDNFALLKIEINQVDHLVIKKPIHIRRRWIRKNEWLEELINP